MFNTDGSGLSDGQESLYGIPGHTSKKLSGREFTPSKSKHTPHAKCWLKKTASSPSRYTSTEAGIQFISWKRVRNKRFLAITVSFDINIAKAKQSFIPLLSQWSASNEAKHMD